MFGLLGGLIEIVFYVIVGIVIGWHFPQPSWAKVALSWLKARAIAAWKWLKREINDDENDNENRR